jgi:hypothetical protein
LLKGNRKFPCLAECKLKPVDIRYRHYRIFMIRLKFADTDLCSGSFYNIASKRYYRRSVEDHAGRKISAT